MEAAKKLPLERESLPANSISVASYNEVQEILINLRAKQRQYVYSALSGGSCSY